MSLKSMLCIPLYTGKKKRKELLEIRVHLAQMLSDIRLDLTSDGVALSLKAPSSSVAEVGSGLCWDFSVSETIAGPVP
jgi:hypothetical protein